MNFVTMFLEAENVHLIKDVGMIPFILHKKFALDSTIACYNNGSYDYLNNEVNGLKIFFVKKYTNIKVLDGILFLLKYAKTIDILNLYHFGLRVSLWIFVYKLMNPKGKIYLKIDGNRNFKNNLIDDKKIRNKIIKRNLKKCTMISIESKELYDFIDSNWSIGVKLIPNGFYNKNNEKIAFQQKENYIITVGRIGSKEKSNEILLEAFAEIYNEIPEWKLKLIGPIEPDFIKYINNYFKKYPLLKQRVIFTGPIYDKFELNEIYKKAKIFCLTSPSEGFPLVFLEAIQNGCYVISSDVTSANDITCNGKYGDVFEVNNVNQLAHLLNKNCKDSIRLKYLCGEIQDFAKENFDWEILCAKIYKYLNG